MAYYMSIAIYQRRKAFERVALVFMWYVYESTEN